MYAIIETGGKQLRVAEGEVIRTDLIDRKSAPPSRSIASARLER